MVSIAEELVLLALDDETGKLRALPDRYLDYALAGAALLDLSKHGRVSLGMESVRVLHVRPTRDPALNLALEQIKERTDPLTLQGALGRIAGQGKPLRELILQRLIDKGILREERGRFLWVFSVRRYPPCDGHEEKEVRNRLFEMLAGVRKPTRRDLILLSLLKASRMIEILLDSGQRDAALRKLSEICADDFLGEALSNSLDEVERAILEIRGYAGM